MYAAFHARLQNVIARCKGVRHLAVGLRALACVTALALLASLLWLVPWPARHATLAPDRQPVPIQASDRPAAETARPTSQPLSIPPAASTAPGQVSEVGTGQSTTSRVDPGQEAHTPTPSGEPAEVLDTQAMQGLVTRLEAARSSSEEHLDTRAMDRLLAELADKPVAPRSKVPKKRARGSPRAAADRGAPGIVSPPRADTVPLRAASEMPFPDMAR